MSKLNFSQLVEFLNGFIDEIDQLSYDAYDPETVRRLQYVRENLRKAVIYSALLIYANNKKEAPFDDEELPFC